MEKGVSSFFRDLNNYLDNFCRSFNVMNQILYREEGIGRGENQGCDKDLESLKIDGRL